VGTKLKLNILKELTMSMSLAFKVREGGYLIEFPYQTSTDVSRKVLKEPIPSKRLHIIKEDLLAQIDEYDGDDVAWYNEIVNEVQGMLNDKKLKLIII
jgi:hypothetical protein